MNSKAEEKDISWPIMEQFYTIQGEGFHSGRPAFFIRTGGCDIGCVWCDVKESWDAKNHPKKNIQEIIKAILVTKANFVVITGGEPAMYDISLLMHELQKLKIEVAIETSGCYKLKGIVDWYCFSPKKFKAPINEAYEKADELKIIIFNKSDFKWAEEHAEKVTKKCHLFLQPEWSKRAEIMPLIIEYIKKNPKWRISLQTHKYMKIP